MCLEQPVKGSNAYVTRSYDHHPEDISLYRFYTSKSTRNAPIASSFSHINHTSNAIPSLHILERCVDARQRLPMRDELIDLEFPIQIVVNKVR